MPSPSPPALDLTRARRFIEEHWPDLRGEGVFHLGAGWDHDVFACAGLVFRFPKNRAAADAIGLEVKLLPFIAGCVPTRVPVPVRTCRGADGGWGSVGHEFIPGVPICDAGLDAEVARDLAVRLANFVRSLHEIELEASGVVHDIPGDTLGRLDEARRGHATREQLFEWKREGVLSDTVVSRLFAILDRWPGPPRTEPRTLIHGDLHSRNLLVTPDGRLSGVLDWVDVHRGHPETDLATAFEVLPAGVRETFFDTYGPVAEETLLRAGWRAIDHLTRAFAGSIERRDESFARASRDALIETSKEAV